MDFSHLGSELETAARTLFSQWSLSSFLGTVLVIVVIVLLIQGVRLFVLRLTKKRSSPQTVLVVNKVFGYGGFVAVALVFLDSVGVDLSAFLAAAGIVGIAVGFAAQSSISNVIAGFFLLAEKPFSVGDVVNTSAASGIVLSIDILSVKLKTFDNTMVRIHNEFLIKDKVINVTRFPIRRLDIDVEVGYASDVHRTLEVLRQVIAANRYALANPEPFLSVRAFASSGIQLMIGVWFEKDDMLALKNSIMIELHERFRLEGIEIPFPQQVIHWAEAHQNSFPSQREGSPS